MIRLGFVLPHLRPGGAERCVVNWLGALDRARFRPFLFLKSVEGGFLDLLPADVTPIALGGARATRLPRAIGAALDAHRIDVAYSATNAMNLALLAATTRARRIVSEHTPPPAYLAEAKWAAFRRLAMRRLYPRADAVAVPTDSIGTALEAELGRSLRVVTLPNPNILPGTGRGTAGEAGGGGGGPQTDPPVDSPLHHAAHSPPPRAREDIRVISAGRLVPAKGFDTLIDAVALVAASGTNLRLDILGEGPLHADLARRIAAHGLADRVTLHGNGDLPAALAAADLFVLASRREGFGNVIVEAMAAGVPVLATSAEGPAALIDHDVTGWLTPPDDPRALADALIRLAADPHRDRVLHAARHTASRYDVAHSTNALSALVERLAATRSMAA